MTEFLGGHHAIVLLLFAGVLSNEVWRVMGLVIGGKIDERAEILVWVRAVAAAILAGVIAQLLISPPGALATVPLYVRIAAAVIGFVAYRMVRKSVIAGVLTGEVVIIAGKWFFG